MSGLDVGYGGPPGRGPGRVVFHPTADSTSGLHPIPASGSTSGVVRSIQ